MCPFRSGEHMCRYAWGALEAGRFDRQGRDALEGSTQRKPPCDPSSVCQCDGLTIEPCGVGGEFSAKLHLHGCLLEFFRYVSKKEERPWGSDSE
jgi:hypothetical protein